jgi:phosphatidylinositol-3,4,5-trisphosphate 3-phosphatase and dual-specificity protein phosphatase PTEN
MNAIKKARDAAEKKVTNVARGLVSKKKIRYQQDGFDLDLAYVTEQIIAMGAPVEGDVLEAKYRNPMEEVIRFMELKHPGHYKIYNLCPKSERDYDYANFQGRVSHIPFDDHNPPLVSKCIRFCEDAHAWLQADPANIIAVHCKAGKGRTGCMIGCYLQHCGMFTDYLEALKFYGEARVSNGKGVTIPSQARYVGYYGKVMRGAVPTVVPALRLDAFRMVTMPKHMSDDQTYYVICANDFPVFDTKNKVSFNTHEGRATPVDYKCGLDVCGDITVEVFDKLHMAGLDLAPRKKKRMFQVAFHTAFIEDHKLILTRAEVDKANKDLVEKGGNFLEGFRIELYFSDIQREDPPVTQQALAFLMGAAPVLSEPAFRETMERNFLVRNPTLATALIDAAPRVADQVSVADFVSSPAGAQLCSALNFRSDTAAVAKSCAHEQQGVVYELEVARGELVDFPTRVFVQGFDLPDIVRQVAENLDLRADDGSPLAIELSCGEQFEAVTQITQLRVRMVVGVWPQGSSTRAELEAEMKREGKKGKGPTGQAYTIVGAKDPLMLRGDVASVAASPEPEPQLPPAAHGSADFAPDAAAARTTTEAAGKYPLGTKVEVYSRSMAKWMRGVVLAVEDDGAVKVSYADDRTAGEKYVDPSDEEQIKLWTAPAETGPTYAAGDSVSVYSRSLQKWVDGKVLGILPNGDVDVSYGDAQNQGRKCIDPADSTLKPKTAAPSSPAPAPAPARPLIPLDSPSPAGLGSMPSMQAPVPSRSTEAVPAAEHAGVAINVVVSEDGDETSFDI